MQLQYRILVINPGSTSTKLGIFKGENCIFEKKVRHEGQDLKSFNSFNDQYNFRKNVILEQLDNEGINISKLDAVCGRGGLLRPIEGGTYEVNKPMLRDLKAAYNGEHPSNLGGILAYEIAFSLNIPAYIVDPVVVDELEGIARFSGIPEIRRKSIFHALNQKAVARRAANELYKTYDSANLIVTHMSSGITIGAHCNGRVIDVNNGLDGDGPFSPKRAGTVPTGDLVSLCFSGRYSRGELIKMLTENGGLSAYLHTNNTAQIEERITKGDIAAQEIYEAMAYQIAKEIGSISTVLAGRIDAIVLTGELAYGKLLVDMISKRIDWIADIFVYPGENELQALNEGTLRVLRNEEKGKFYPNNDVRRGV